MILIMGMTVNINAEQFGLTAANAAALAGLRFTFPDGSIFGDRCAADQPATLTFGEAGDTFILVCGDGDNDRRHDHLCLVQI